MNQINSKLTIEKSIQKRAELHERLVKAIVRGSCHASSLETILAELEREFCFQRYLIFYHDQDKNLISVLESRGFEKELASQISFLKTAIDQAIAPRVVWTGEYYFTLDSQSDEKINFFWRKKLGLQGPLLALPLRVVDFVCGVLVVNDEKLREDHVKVLLPFVYDLAVAVTIDERNQQILARQRTIDLMRYIQSQFKQAREDERVFLDSVAETVAQIMNARLCAIYRRVREKSDVDPNMGTVFERRGAFGYPQLVREDKRVPRKGKGAGLTNHALAGKIINVPNVEDDKRWSGKEAEALREVLHSEIRAFLGVPMTGSNGDIIGCITLTRPRVSKEDGLLFRAQDVDLVTAICSAVASLLDTIDTMEEIKRHHAQLDALFTALSERVHEEVSVVDNNFTILYANPAKKMKFEKDLPLEGQKCYKVYEKRESVCPNCPIQTAIKKAVSGDLTPVHDTSHYGRPTGGEVYHAGVIACAITDPTTGNVTGAVEVVRDLTEEARDRDLPILYGAHAISTDLDTIRTRLSTIEFQMEDGQITGSEPLREHLRTLMLIVDRADAFISALFDTARHVELDHKPHNIQRMISNVLENHAIRFNVISEPKDRQWILNCDGDKLSTVFHELVRNAERAIKGRGIALQITVTLQPWICENAEHGLQISFADNGPGVPIEARPRIFERFFSKFDEGHGLGLFLARRIIEAHEGIIDLGNQGLGAVFHIFLPRSLEVKYE